MFENYVILVKSDLNGQLRLLRADEYSISDGQIVGYLNPEVFGVTELINLYDGLQADEWFDILPLQYSGNNYTEARAIAMRAHPGGWKPAVSFDGWVNANGVRPFVAGGHWFVIRFHREDI